MAKGIVADSIQNARTLLLAHSAAVAANDIIVSNGNILVAVNTALISANNAYVYMGKVIFPKVAGTAFDPGDKCYWDAAAGNITKVTSGNTLCGFCTEAAGASAASIVMMLRKDSGVKSCIITLSLPSPVRFHATERERFSLVSLAEIVFA